jgi:hypothetical protein
MVIKRSPQAAAIWQVPANADQVLVPLLIHTGHRQIAKLAQR